MIADISQIIFEWILRWDQTLGIIISAGLSLALVWLYNQQKNILDEQRTLSAAEQKSKLRTRDYDLVSWATQFAALDIEDIPEPYHNTAMLYAEVENIGKGAAFDIESSLYIHSKDHKIAITTPLSHFTNTDQLSLNQEGESLGPGEHEYMTSFYDMEAAELPEEMQRSEITLGERITPSEILWILEDLGYYDVEIGILIHYSDQTGIRDAKRLITTKGNLREYRDINQALTHGEYPDVNKDGKYNHQIEDLFNLWGEEADSSSK
jgi:hypothetical protein